MTRTSGVLREAHRAKGEGEMERGPFKRPSRRSGTGGLSSTPGPACGSFLGENHPQARSPEAPLTPGPARPCPAAATPPYPAVCRLLPALSDLLIFHLTRRFPSSPTPSPRLRPEARLRRGRRHAKLYSMDPAPCQARKTHPAGAH